MLYSHYLNTGKSFLWMVNSCLDVSFGTIFDAIQKLDNLKGIQKSPVFECPVFGSLLYCLLLNLFLFQSHFRFNSFWFAFSPSSFFFFFCRSSPFCIDVVSAARHTKIKSQIHPRHLMLGKKCFFSAYQESANQGLVSSLVFNDN